MTTSKISIKDIRLDPSLQPRVNGLDLDHVRALEEAPEVPPIKVVVLDGRYVAVDGLHRIARAENLGLAEIEAEVLPLPADGDLHALAFALNAVHGRPLTGSDRKAEAARLLRAQADRSNREIAGRCGISDKTVAAVRVEMEATAEIPQLTSRRGTDNKTRPVSITTKPAAPGSAPASARKSAGQNGRTPKQAPANRTEPAFAALQDLVGRQMTYADNHASDGLDEALAMAVAGHWPPSEWNEVAEVLANSGSAFLSAANLLQKRLQALPNEAVRAKEPHPLPPVVDQLPVTPLGLVQPSSFINAEHLFVEEHDDLNVS